MYIHGANRARAIHEPVPDLQHNDFPQLLTILTPFVILVVLEQFRPVEILNVDSGGVRIRSALRSQPPAMPGFPMPPLPHPGRHPMQLPPSLLLGC